LEAPTFGRLVEEVVVGVVLYDLLFYPLHWAMHNLPFAPLRSIHGFHHRKSHTLNPLETVQHSYADGFLQVAVNIAVQQISPFSGLAGKHPLSRLLHNVIVTYLLTESHSGYRDLPFMSHVLYPSVFGGAPRHEAHHHDGRVYYHQVCGPTRYPMRPRSTRHPRAPTPDRHAPIPRALAPVATDDGSFSPT
jgi:cholesterol 25-hydroxylase